MKSTNYKENEAARQSFLKEARKRTIFYGIVVVVELMPCTEQ